MEATAALDQSTLLSFVLLSKAAVNQPKQLYSLYCRSSAALPHLSCLIKICIRFFFLVEIVFVGVCVCFVCVCVCMCVCVCTHACTKKNRPTFWRLRDVPSLMNGFELSIFLRCCRKFGLFLRLMYVCMYVCMYYISSPN
jgi:hypothetical protein